MSDSATTRLNAEGAQRSQNKIPLTRFAALHAAQLPSPSRGEGKSRDDLENTSPLEGEVEICDPALVAADANFG
jgi:hypothetical protein